MGQDPKNLKFLPLRGTSATIHFLKPQFLYFNLIYDSNVRWVAKVVKSRDEVTSSKSSETNQTPKID